jgi:tungstate transport system substrate-binding protein
MSYSCKLHALRSLCVALLVFIVPVAVAAADMELRVAITTSFKDSGLADIIFPAFEKSSGETIRLYVVGSGAALRMARTSEVDVTITHAPNDEHMFIHEDKAVSHRHVMTNDFFLVGPGSDPAHVRDTKDILVAIRQIAENGERFASRGDDSGTHKLEMRLWKAADIDPIGQTWYEELGLGMLDTLLAADKSGAYLLVDRGTWLANRNNVSLKSLLSGDKRLLNRYVAIAVKGSGHEDSAKALLSWLGTPDAKTIINNQMIDGQHLFDLPAGH